MAALRRLRGSHRVTILAAGLVAVAVALAAEATHVVAAQEQDTIGLRFQLRGAQPATDVAVVAIDDETFAALERWPFRRSLHARPCDALRAAGARGIVYDVQFTEPTRARDDLALYDALGAGRRRHARHRARSTSDGAHAVLGGDENLARDRRARPPRPTSRRPPAATIRALPLRGRRAADDRRRGRPARRAGRCRPSAFEAAAR